MYTNWKDPENEERLRSAVRYSRSIAQVCRLLGLKDCGGNYRTIKHHISRLSLDTSHHLGKAWNRDNYSTPNPERKISTLKQYLIREHGHYCWHCHNTDWQGKPIPLELDHIDGVAANNTLDNLRILCCNCHALTSTWRRKK